MGWRRQAGFPGRESYGSSSYARACFGLSLSAGSSFYGGAHLDLTIVS
jgi:hypothetical protein